MSWNDNNQGPWGKPSGGNYGGGNRPSPGGAPSGGGPDWNMFSAKVRETFDHFFSGDGGHKRLIGAIVLFVLLVWLGSGIYQIQSGVQGVVLRFGQFNRTVGAGPHYHLPAPIEMVYVVNTQLVRKELFGNSPDQPEDADASAESLMLTGDENIIDITFDVQWNIQDANAFLFNVRDPVTTVRNVAESAMREVIGQTEFTVAQTGGKSRIEQDVKTLAQQTLDSYHAGIRILTVNLLESSAPGPVVEAVRDVQAARADEERSRNEAEAYHNDIIPERHCQPERKMLGCPQAL